MKRVGMYKLMFKLWLIAVLCATTLGVHAAVRPLLDQNPTVLGTTGGPAQGSRGWRFRANANVTVTELGLTSPATAGQVLKVNLWSVATQTLLATSNFNTSGLPSTWAWQGVAPVALTSGQEYIVSVYAAAAVGNWYHFGHVAANPTWKPSGVIQYLDMRFNNASGDVYPTSTLVDFQYGVPDIGYVMTVAPAPVSVPSSSDGVLVLLAGLLGAAALIRIKSRTQ
jgi:Domain of unknown function (DUF4082)